jgi:ABC-type multidrug transport system fused ATPase/permease subunit
MYKTFKIVNYLTNNRIFLLIFIIICASLFELAILSLLTPIFNYFSGTSSVINFLNLESILEKKIDIKIFLLLFLIIFTIRCFLSIIISYNKGKLIKQINDKLSERIYSNYIKKDFAFFAINNSSKLISDIIFEVQKFSYGVVDSLLICFTEIFLILSVLIYLLSVYFKEGFLLIIFFLSFFIIFYKYFKVKFQNLGKIKIEHDTKKLDDLQTSFYIIQNIKLDNLESFFNQKFKISTNQSSKSSFYLQFVGEAFKPIIEFIVFLIFCAIIYIFFIYFQLPKQEIFFMISLFIIGIFRILPSFNKVFHNLNNFKFNYLTIDIIYSKIFEYDFSNTIFQEDIYHKFKFNKVIEFKNVDFSYSENKKGNLQNINIKIKKNKIIGIFGESGSGKTTLLNLICYLLKPSSGNIFVDDMPIEKVFKSFQKVIGYVSQRVYLTDDTIINNIILGKEKNTFNYKLFDEVIKKSGLESAIKTFPLGKDTVIGERGSRLSGGQQQRIGIARALYKEPEILILDEATSALDVNSEKEIFNVIQTLKNKITIIIVSHKKSIMEFCDTRFKVEKHNVTEEL